MREARSTARLLHPNIVAVFDAGEADGSLYIVMEFVAGRTLADEIKVQGRIATDHATALAHVVVPVPDVSSLRDDLSATMVRVFDTVLKKDPAARFPTAEAMRDA